MRSSLFHYAFNDVGESNHLTALIFESQITVSVREVANVRSRRSFYGFSVSESTLVQLVS